MGSTISSSPPEWLARVRIRHLTSEDLPELEWDGEYKHFRRVYAHAYERMKNGLGLIWVAELPGTGILGQVFLQLICDRPELADGHRRAYLYSFRVKPAYQNSGLGSQMMERLEKDLKRKGFRAITLNVAKENTRAQSLYKRRGYYIVAHEPGVWTYIDDEGELREKIEPAWRMEKIL